MTRQLAVALCAVACGIPARGDADVRIVAFGARDAVATAGEETSVRCGGRNAGDAAAEGIEVRCGSDADLGIFLLGRLEPGEEREVLSPLTPGRAGFAPLLGRVADQDGDLDEVRWMLPVLARDAQADYEIRCGDAILRFPRMAAGNGVTEIIGVGPEGEERLGIIPSLATLRLGGDPCPLPIYAILDPTDGGGLTGEWTGPLCTVAVDIRPLEDGRFAIRCTLTAFENLELLGLVCPELHIGSGEGDGYRAQPPAAGSMGLSSDETGWTVAIGWRNEAGAVLSSPNALGGMGDHLMALAWPDSADAENQAPLTLSAGDTVVLTSDLRVNRR